MNHKEYVNRLIVPVFILCFLASCGTAVSTSTPPSSLTSVPPGSMPTRVPTVYGWQTSVLPVVYEIPGMDQVTVHKNLTYKTAASLALKMDVYYPTKSGLRSPAVIFIHGDFSAEDNIKDTRPFVSWGQLTAASGMAAVTFNYSYYSSGSADTNDLLQFVRTNAETLKIDKERICLFGFSAGASLAAAAGIRGTPDYVRCIVAYYGNMDSALTKLKDEKAEKVAPILIVKAAEDELVSATSLDRFVSEATVLGARVTLLTHPSGVHFFDVRNDDEQSRAIIKKTLEFLQAHLLTR